MKLWIRSADREHFTEAHGIDYNMDCIVDSMTEEEKYCHKIVDDRGKVLGIYETKERCLEIIDEILYLLKNNGSTEDRMSQLLSGIENEFVVYEMPEE